MELRKFTFKYPGYFYDEECFDSLVRAFDLTTDEYKQMSEAEQKAFYKEKFEEMCKASIGAVIAKKLESLNAHFINPMRGMDMDIVRTFETLPLELYPNIVEWANDEEISEIDWNGLSIKKMIDKMDFPPFEAFKSRYPDITEEKYITKKARAYLQVFELVGWYSTCKKANPMEFLMYAAGLGRVIM